jgi:hypothetical protein
MAVETLRRAAPRPERSAQETAPGWSRLATILLGMALIAVLTPLTQFLTVMTVNADIETATPVGWAVGVVFSLVLGLALLRLISKRRLVSRANLVILYCMLTLSAPLMNIGLIRPCYLSMQAVFQEYLVVGTSTYRTAYNSLKPAWFPVVPTTEGLAWNMAERLLRLLEDDAVLRARLAAQRRLDGAVALETLRLEQAGRDDAPPVAPPPGPDARAKLSRELETLGVDQLAALRRPENLAALESLGLAEPLEREWEQKSAASRAAADELPGLLEGVDEFMVTLLPEHLVRTDPSSLHRIDMELMRLGDAERDRLQQQVSDLQPRVGRLRAAVTALGTGDRARVRNALRDRYLAQFAQMDEETLLAARSSFVYRLTTRERSELIQQDGRGEAPNQNLYGFTRTIWWDAAREQEKQRQSWTQNLGEVLRHLPWGLWARPMAMWTLLFVSIFLLLMCVAEWLRRKWVDRENLAFPVVDVVDNIIRHDATLETAEDVKDPPPRARLFSPIFGAGFAVGFLILFLEALGHYGFIGTRPLIQMDVSGRVFTTGIFLHLTNVVMVISPIVVGLLFLVSLEISFSIWVIFVLYMLVVMVVREVGAPIDTIYTGWAGGRFFPFSAEQLVGATLCFAAVVLYKTWRTGARPERPAAAAATEQGPQEPFVPPRLNAAGLIGLPVLIIGLLWHMGITNLPFILLVAVFVMALTIAAARARAETGLHTHHVTYELTKLPLVFGLTGFTGASVYTRFISLAFLPVTLLFRTLPQQLENIELARRHRIRYRTVAVAGLAAFLTAVSVGMLSYVVFAYYLGGRFIGETVFEGQGPATPFAMARYPLWVSHFLGEHGLDKYTQPHWIRIWFMALGFGGFGLLYWLRNRFLRFPLHPLGYLLILLSIYYTWVSPYYKGDGKETSWLWGSALVAWGIKKLIVKYGGMNTYKRAKPFFIGLVVGSVFCIFAWNLTDLTCSLLAQRTSEPAGFIKHFTEKQPFSPSFY